MGSVKEEADWTEGSSGAAGSKPMEATSRASTERRNAKKPSWADVVLGTDKKPEKEEKEKEPQQEEGEEKAWWHKHWNESGQSWTDWWSAREAEWNEWQEEKKKEAEEEAARQVEKPPKEEDEKKTEKRNWWESTATKEEQQKNGQRPGWSRNLEVERMKRQKNTKKETGVGQKSKKPNSNGWRAKARKKGSLRRSLS